MISIGDKKVQVKQLSYIFKSGTNRQRKKYNATNTEYNPVINRKIKRKILQEKLQEVKNIKKAKIEKITETNDP